MTPRDHIHTLGGLPVASKNVSLSNRQRAEMEP
jgi:hypothetical protein